MLDSVVLRSAGRGGRVCEGLCRHSMRVSSGVDFYRHGARPSILNEPQRDLGNDAADGNSRSGEGVVPAPESLGHPCLSSRASFSSIAALEGLA